MIEDARSLANGAVIEADLCVVGGGAAGITIAEALEGSGLSVVLLESGGIGGEEATTDLSRGQRSGEPYLPLDACRLRYFGGSTNHWAGWSRPLEPEDFVQRAWVKGSGWPFGFEELLPWYRKAQLRCGLGPWDYDAAAWAGRTGQRLLGLDAGLAEPRLWQLSGSGEAGGKRFAVGAGGRLVGTRVLLHANAVDLRDQPGSSSVICRVLGGPEFSVVARATVLATGGIENPRLLLASSLAGRVDAHERVGACFAEHPHALVGAVLLDGEVDLALYRRRFEVGGGFRGIRVGIGLPASVRAAEGLLDGYVALAPAAGIGIEEDEVAAVGALARAFGASGRGVLHGLLLRAEQEATSESRVTLGADRDALGMPRAHLHWQVSEGTRRSMKRTVELLAAALGGAGIGRVFSWAHTDRDRPPEAWPRLDGGCHHLGTTRMHADPRSGVVDAQCRVHGTDRLYVAGSSLFPTSGSANPTLTLVALAERLAEHLRGVLA